MHGFAFARLARQSRRNIRTSGLVVHRVDPLMSLSTSFETPPWLLEPHWTTRGMNGNRRPLLPRLGKSWR